MEGIYIFICCSYSKLGKLDALSLDVKIHLPRRLTVCFPSSSRLPERLYIKAVKSCFEKRRIENLTTNPRLPISHLQHSRVCIYQPVSLPEESVNKKYSR